MITETRFALQTEIELTREKFHRMLVTVPESALQLPSKISAWTNGEVLYSISVSPLYIRSILKRNSGSWTQGVLPKLVSGTLVDWKNGKPVRAAVPNLTLLSLAKEYEYNCKLALNILADLSEADFGKVVRIHEPDPILAEHVTIEQLFHYVKNFFNLYRKEIELAK